MFTQEQKDALKAKLDSSRVKQRQQAGRTFSYVEGWHVIAEANRIFGFECWHRETTELRQLFEPFEKDGKWRAAYMAKVRVSVFSGEAPCDVTIREGTGYGSGIARDLGDAHESAIKEAETDAMKRALMTFGNPFGLALYDKEQTNVEAAPSPSNAFALEAVSKLKALDSIAALSTWAEANKAHLEALPDDLKRTVRAAYSQRTKELTKEAA